LLGARSQNSRFATRPASPLSSGASHLLSYRDPIGRIVTAYRFAFCQATLSSRLCKGV
jgi:hypothetical protein